MLKVTTQDGATYLMALEDPGLHGQVLSISRVGGTDDPPLSNSPMTQDRWYEVHVMDPSPPTIGSELSMVLDPVPDDSDPVVRKTGMVTSVVGLLEPRVPPPARTPAPDPVASPSAPPSQVQLSPDTPIPPRAASSAIAARSDTGFFNSERKLTKTSGLFAAVMGLAAVLGRSRP